jgi:hypothetical protein
MVTVGSRVSVRRRLVVTAVAVCGLAVPLLGACGGGGGGGGGASSTATTSAAPGANVDPNATGYIGGSINRAKTVASQQEQHDNQIQQQGGAGQP